jgi:hypothetical protein
MQEHPTKALAAGVTMHAVVYLYAVYHYAVYNM